MKLSQAGVRFRKNLPVSVCLSWPTFKGLVFSVSHRGDFRSVFPRGLVGRSTESSPGFTPASPKMAGDNQILKVVLWPHLCWFTRACTHRQTTHTPPPPHTGLFQQPVCAPLIWNLKKKMRTQRESAQRYRSRFILNTQSSFTFSKQKQHSLRWLSKLSWFDYSSQRQKITHLFIGKYV